MSGVVEISKYLLIMELVAAGWDDIYIVINQIVYPGGLKVPCYASS